MLSVAGSHIELAAGFAEDRAHFGHALFCVFRSNEAVGWLVLLRREVPHFRVIFIEQNLGPHMEQKCALFAPSAGSVWS